MLARLRANKLLRAAGLRAVLVGTIHDSIVVDCPSEEVGRVVQILREAVEGVPADCKKVFGYTFDLPLTCEIGFGPNKKEMTEA